MIRNALFLFAICAAIFVFYLPSYIQMQELHEKNSSYQRQIKELAAENEQAGEEKRRLEQDPTYFEKVAREKMGLIKDDEMVYKIVPGTGAPGAEGTSAQTVNAQAPVKATVVQKPGLKFNTQSAKKKKSPVQKKSTAAKSTKNITPVSD